MLQSEAMVEVDLLKIRNLRVEPLVQKSSELTGRSSELSVLRLCNRRLKFIAKVSVTIEMLQTTQG